MIDGFTQPEIADYFDALRRRSAAADKLRPDPPWKTMSGFSDQFMFLAALARSWPMFPLTGDYVRLFKIFDWNAPIIAMPSITRAISSDELSYH